MIIKWHQCWVFFFFLCVCFKSHCHALQSYLNSFSAHNTATSLFACVNMLLSLLIKVFTSHVQHRSWDYSSKAFLM